MKRAALLVSACELALVVSALAGCRLDQTLVTPDPHLERMLDQPKAMPYAADTSLPLGMTMQQPPDGTIPVDTVVDRPLYTTGVKDGRFADRIPVLVDRELVETGQARFEVFCAACHGLLGDGESVVADRMNLRKPPSLHLPPAKTDTPGRIFQIVRNGYGFMPSYAVQISIHDTWAVIAYVHALQLARRAPVANLPPEIRARLAKEAP